jgi:hypothetical protein
MERPMAILIDEEKRAKKRCAGNPVKHGYDGPAPQKVKE